MRWSKRIPRTQPGEVWRVDLGPAAKVRPCLILSDYPADDELALIVIIPHTTSVRGNRWELAIPKPFLKAGEFHLQQIQAIPIARLQRKLGSLSVGEFESLKTTLARLLNLQS